MVIDRGINYLTYEDFEILGDASVIEYKFSYEQQKAIDLISICYVQVGNLLWVDNNDELLTIDIDKIKLSYATLKDIKKYMIYEKKEGGIGYNRIFFTEKLKNKYNP